MTKEELQELERLLSLTWNNQKMVDHCMKSSKYIVIGDLFVNVCDAKPSINKTLWYDDEQEGPDVNLQTFKYYNRHNFPSLKELRSRHLELYFVVNYHNDKSGGRLASLVYEELPSNLPLIRKVAPEELELINVAIREEVEKYEKRLENYFKKYSNKIHAAGYWANR